MTCFLHQSVCASVFRCLYAGVGGTDACASSYSEQHEKSRSIVVYETPIFVACWPWVMFYISQLAWHMDRGISVYCAKDSDTVVAPWCELLVGLSVC